MRFLFVYLAVYFALVAGALVALWQSGALAHFSAFSIVLALVCVVGLGALLALVWAWRPGRVRQG